MQQLTGLWQWHLLHSPQDNPSSSSIHQCIQIPLFAGPFHINCPSSPGPVRIWSCPNMTMGEDGGYTWQISLRQPHSTPHSILQDYIVHWIKHVQQSFQNHPFPLPSSLQPRMSFLHLGIFTQISGIGTELWDGIIMDGMVWDGGLDREGEYHTVTHRMPPRSRLHVVPALLSNPRPASRYSNG